MDTTATTHHETPGIGYVAPAQERFQQLLRAQQLIVENCSEWPVDEVDEVMLLLHGSWG